MLAFGPLAFKPSEQKIGIIRECVHKARHGDVPEAASKAYAWMAAQDYPLPLAYEVDLRIIGSAVLGAAVVAYLLKVSLVPPGPSPCHGLRAEFCLSPVDRCRSTAPFRVLPFAPSV